MHKIDHNYGPQILKQRLTIFTNNGRKAFYESQDGSEAKLCTKGIQQAHQVSNRLKKYKWFNFKNPIQQARRYCSQVTVNKWFSTVHFTSRLCFNQICSLYCNHSRLKRVNLNLLIIVFGSVLPDPDTWHQKYS